MINRTTQSLLAERREAVLELRRADSTTRAVAQFGIDEIDRELAERKVIAAGIIQPPVKIAPRPDAIDTLFIGLNAEIVKLELERDDPIRNWSPAQGYWSAA